MTLKKFPATLNKLAWSSTKSLSWDVTAQTSGSGRVRTLTNQLLPCWTIETKFAHLNDEEARRFLGFVASVKGGFEPFLWKDPEDHKAAGQVCAMSEPGKYQAVIPMGDFLEPCEYIEDVTVYVDGTKQDQARYSVANGMIIFHDGVAPAAGAVVKADYTYYFKVRFKDSSAGITAIFNNFNQSKTFKLMTAR